MRNLHTARYKKFLAQLLAARTQKGVSQVEAARALRIPQSLDYTSPLEIEGRMGEESPQGRVRIVSPERREVPMEFIGLEPALSAKAWAEVTAGNGIPYAYGSSILDDLSMLEGRDIPAAIAYLNHQLPASDARKVLAFDVEQLRIVAAELRASNPEAVGKTMSARASLTRLADALESYLPPEPT